MKLSSNREDLIRASKGVGLCLISTWQQLQYSKSSTASLFYNDQVVMSHSQQGARLNMVPSQNTAQSAGWPIGGEPKTSPRHLSRLAGGFMGRSTLARLKITTSWGGTRFLTPWHIVLLFRVEIFNYLAVKPAQQFVFFSPPFFRNLNFRWP